MKARPAVRRPVGLAVLVLSGLLAITACSGEPGAAGDPRPPARITVQVGADPEEAAVYRSLVSAYQEAGGGEVDLVTVARGDHLTRLSTAFTSGAAPDVFLINYREYAPFVQRGAVAPAGPLLEQQGLKTADYYEQPLKAFSYNGALQCMPQNISSLVVYWNRALFRQAGVTPPKAGWSWAEFVATARALTKGSVKGVGIDPSITRMAPFIWSSGGSIVDDDAAPTRTTLHEPGARGALQAVVDLIGTGATPSKEQLAAQDVDEQFMTGKLAMFLSSRVEVPALREQRGLDFDVAGLPVLGKPASVLHSDAYCVASSSKHQDAAADFIAYAVGQQGQTITALGGRTVPSLRSVATSSAFLSPSRPPASSQVFLDAIPQLRHTPVTPSWPEVEDVIGNQLQRAFLDGVPLDEVLAAIRAQADPLLRRR
ncbi:extracellular solute-binding protein family 1 [Kribbella flavida DSM 17836]|uniref:Extracellular solute-binding protein family 1 n=1 Tax=Kribbella flavida (strain DSM 17836 / JCM 10339 / NBRC 14399) TaxID=479435 RepID=D2Q4F9_KRIFD|nr:sugar ABC transporter substrate-binding protein [Kribbella flavida]ADB32273.1 extracellular solute-binding protein family 1 [Kribbella flavida DSM 17836]